MDIVHILNKRDIRYYILSDNIILLYLAHYHWSLCIIYHVAWYLADLPSCLNLFIAQRFLHASNQETSLLLNCRYHCNVACLCMMCILNCDPAGSIIFNFRWMFPDATLPNTITVCQYVKKCSAAASFLEMEWIPGRYVLCAKF